MFGSQLQKWYLDSTSVSHLMRGPVGPSAPASWLRPSAASLASFGKSVGLESDKLTETQNLQTTPPKKEFLLAQTYYSSAEYPENGSQLCMTVLKCDPLCVRRYRRVLIDRDL